MKRRDPQRTSKSTRLLRDAELATTRGGVLGNLADAFEPLSQNVIATVREQYR